MNELMNSFGQTGSTQSFDQISISIASPEAIKSWSFVPLDHFLHPFCSSGRSF